MKRKKVQVKSIVNRNIDYAYEYKLSPRKTAVPGSKLKFTGERGTFTFTRLASNHMLDVQWIDCLDINTKEYRSFYVERLKKIIN